MTYKIEIDVTSAVQDFYPGLSDSDAAATYASWTSDKTLAVYGRGYSTSSYWYNYHNTHYSNGGGTDVFCQPKLIITALQ